MVVDGKGNLIPKPQLRRVKAQKAQRRDVHGKDRRVFRARIRDEPLCKRSEFRRKLPVFEHPRIFSERAQPEAAFCVGHRMVDDKALRDTDYYYVRVRQRDGQWGWSSPIWVERA